MKPPCGSEGWPFHDCMSGILREQWPSQQQGCCDVPARIEEPSLCLLLVIVEVSSSCSCKHRGVLVGPRGGRTAHQGEVEASPAAVDVVELLHVMQN